MKAFISYSHDDKSILDKLHIHLAQLKREGLLSSWTDESILAGSKLNSLISKELESSQLFIAILSPAYIASKYCYEKEFLNAMEKEANGSMIIIPIIAEPCDWLNTPFKEFRALPNDGKAISLWENENTSFLDIIQNLRRLIEYPSKKEAILNENSILKSPSARNYQVKKDFDSIQKLEFVERTFKELKDALKRSLDELSNIDDNIKYRLVKNEEGILEYILVNRNKIGMEAILHIEANFDYSQQKGYSSYHKELSYKITQDNRQSENGFSLSNDDYHMFWTPPTNMYSRENNEFTTKDIIDEIWEKWLNGIGIM